jgi:hypothetical protein
VCDDVSSVFTTVLERLMKTLAIAALIATAATGAQAIPTAWAENGHAYEIVWGGISWTDARLAAESAAYRGLTGYLATITSVAEQGFLNTLNWFDADLWIGASDAATEGDWRWVGGPEAGERVGDTFWARGEPNDYGAGEDYAAGWWSGNAWNDLPNRYGSVIGYVVEYSAANMPAVPLPAGLPLLLSGIAAIGWAARRKR